MSMDYLAYFILLVVYIFVAIPLIGSAGAFKGDSYLERLGIGGMMHFLFISLGGIVFSVQWAFGRVF